LPPRIKARGLSSPRCPAYAIITIGSPGMLIPFPLDQSKYNRKRVGQKDLQFCGKGENMINWMKKRISPQIRRHILR
jgi:hypothetical protein